MKKVIITGANGFVGYAAVKCFLSHGVDVLAVDVQDSRLRSLRADSHFSYLQADISKPDQLSVIPPDNFDTFIHFAWMGSAGDLRTDYTQQLNNALWTVECLKIAQRIGCKRFVCAGSIMEKEVALTMAGQGSRPAMGYIYGFGKLAAHLLCACVASQIGIDLIWPVITNAYGEGELSPRFINTTLRKIINHEPLQFTSATQNYDFVHIEDVAKAFYLISQHGKPFYEYVIGSSDARPLKEFIIEMREVLASDAELNFGDVPFTGTDLPLSAFDASQTYADTGFKAEISFADGVRRTMDWLKSLESSEC